MTKQEKQEKKRIKKIQRKAKIISFVQKHAKGVVMAFLACIFAVGFIFGCFFGSNLGQRSGANDGVIKAKADIAQFAQPANSMLHYGDYDFVVVYSVNIYQSTSISAHMFRTIQMLLSVRGSTLGEVYGVRVLSLDYIAKKGYDGAFIVDSLNGNDFKIYGDWSTVSSGNPTFYTAGLPVTTEKTFAAQSSIYVSQMTTSLSAFQPILRLSEYANGSIGALAFQIALTWGESRDVRPLMLQDLSKGKTYSFLGAAPPSFPSDSASYFSFLRDYSTGFSDGASAGFSDGFSNGVESGKAVGYENGYRSGKEDGYQEGYTNGSTAGDQAGYQRGYQAGTQVGYQDGYNKGVQEGDENTFLSLLTAVVDAPVAVFSGIFDVEILGYNMKNVFFALLSVALVFAVYRLFSGGGK